MGKSEHHLPLQSHQETGSGNVSNSSFFRNGCIVGCLRVFKEFNFKCMFVLICGFAVLLSAIFWIIPLRSKHFGFDAKDSIKLGATVQAYFELDRPVSSIVHHINELEYEINSEIGVLDAKVAILSMHEGIAYNKTNVVFGFLSDPSNVLINPVSLSLLKQSLMYLYTQQLNLTFSKSFGESSSFEILKFPSGITLNPYQYSPFGRPAEILFNFTLNNSIDEISENLNELKEQLRKTLQLMQYENVYAGLTNRKGSTRDPPVTVQAYITSNFGILSPQRLNQLAQIIKGTPLSKNLGLNHKVFGKVKEISLTSFLNHSSHSMPPSPSPSPANGPSPSVQPHIHHHHHHHHHHLPPSNDNHHNHPYSKSPSPSPSPSHSPSPSPVSNCGRGFFPSHSPSPSPIRSHNSFAPSPAPSKDLHVKNPPSPSYSQHSEPHLSPKQTPLPGSSYSPSPRHNIPVYAPDDASPPWPSSFATRTCCWKTLSFTLLLTIILL